MVSRKLAIVAVPFIALVALGVRGRALDHASRAPAAREYTDFGRTTTPTEPAYVARLAPASPAPMKEFRIPVLHTRTTLADGVEYEAWTFGGTVPGPVIRVREGDRVRVRFVNQGPIPHSIDFHSQRTAMSAAMRDVMPNDSLTFEFTARDPGAYMVHCTTQPVALHVMQGMYLPMIVDPKGGWGTTADAEFVLVQSEFYARAGQTAGGAQPDWDAALRKAASHVVFNGRAFQYRAAPLQVRLGDRVRLFVINAGPNYVSNFHIVGAVFDRVYPGGRPDQAIDVVQTWPIPAGGSAVFETVFDVAGGEGIYPFVTHSFTDAFKGGTGHFQVGAATHVASRH